MKKKIIAMCLILALGTVAVIGGTLAYFTDDDSATNTITVGNVEIDLTELLWDTSGVVDGKEVYPGEPLAKNPVVENTGANPCFVRISVTGLDTLAPAGDITYRTDGVDGKLGTDWVLYGDYFYYTKPLVVIGTEGNSWNAGLVSKTDALFDQIVIPTDLENGNASTEFDIEVVAEAVQAQGAKAPNWAEVKGMSVAEIDAWFALCLAP